MRSIVQTSYGPPKQSVEIANLDRPFPSSSQLLIKVSASSINPIDLWTCNGYGRDLFESQRSLPATLGRDCSGHVVGVGSSVWNFKVGDQVFASVSPLHTGLQSEYVVVNERMVANKPKSLNHREAASLGYSGLTAYKAIVETMNVKEGQIALVLGASGGIGLFAVQLLKLLGAKVIATCGRRNLELVKKMGADHVIEYETLNPSPFDYSQEFTKFRYDLVLDGVYTSPEDRSKLLTSGLVNQGGHYVSLNGDMIRRIDDRGLLLGAATSFIELASEKLVQGSGRGYNYDWLLYSPSGENLSKIGELVDIGAIKPHLDPKKFTLDQAKEAYDYFENSRPSGKVIIDFES